MHKHKKAFVYHKHKIKFWDRSIITGFWIIIVVVIAQLILHLLGPPSVVRGIDAFFHSYCHRCVPIIVAIVAGTTLSAAAFLSSLLLLPSTMLSTLSSLS